MLLELFKIDPAKVKFIFTQNVIIDLYSRDDFANFIKNYNIKNNTEIYKALNENATYFFEKYFLSLPKMMLFSALKEFINQLIEEKVIKNNNFDLLDMINDLNNSKDELEEKYHIFSQGLTYLFQITNEDGKPFFKEKETDPRQFYLLKDKKEDVQLSSISPYDFSKIRTSPLIVIDDKVLNKYTADLTGLNIEDIHHQDLMDWYNKTYNIKTEKEVGLNDNYDQYNAKNVAVGSEFGKVALLELIEGNIDAIKQQLIKYGYKKIYINNFASWTSKEYKRIAKKRLFKKY